MPFCSQCGNQVIASDAYCARCGARQPAPAAEAFSSLTPRKAAVLCYVPIVGWIASIIVLASDRFRTDRMVRFHAFQGLYLFVAWLIVHEVVGPMFDPLPGPNYISKCLHLAVLAVWVLMLVKTSQDETYSLPVLGELAEKSLSER
jgi:uncharacterized membrane protein